MHCQHSARSARSHKFLVNKNIWRSTQNPRKVNDGRSEMDIFEWIDLKRSMWFSWVNLLLQLRLHFTWLITWLLFLTGRYDSDCSQINRDLLDRGKAADNLAVIDLRILDQQQEQSWFRNDETAETESKMWLIMICCRILRYNWTRRSVVHAGHLQQVDRRVAFILYLNLINATFRDDLIRRRSGVRFAEERRSIDGYFPFSPSECPASSQLISLESSEIVNL
jgi:hypothetical protein